MGSKKWTTGLWIFYLIALTWIILFKLQFSITDLPHLRNINLIPFGESVIANGRIYINEIIWNLLVFIPYGLFIHILWEDRPLLKQFIPIICTSLLFEIVQFIFAIGASDITDLITNSLGGIIGVFVAIGISKVVKKNWVKLINIISLTGGILLTLFLAILLLANL
ncbi:MAG: VanZ family protein [Lachnospiraceae bacterium]|nr:VanZ family protein [Lachnospiraceae bacterium]